MTKGSNQEKHYAIVKIGGSLLESGKLLDCLNCLIPFRGKIIIVSGGGEFANFIRREQRQRGFSDSTAHQLALLAMEQMAHLMAEIGGSYFSLFSTLDQAKLLTEKQQIPIWLPSMMAGASHELAASWRVTSDSLAAWLATVAAAKKLFLIKSVDFAAYPSVARHLTLPSETVAKNRQNQNARLSHIHSFNQWQELGWVDEDFPYWANRSAASIYLVTLNEINLLYSVS